MKCTISDTEYDVEAEIGFNYEDFTIEQLHSFTLKQLQEIAVKVGLRLDKKWKKKKLIELLGHFASDYEGDTVCNDNKSITDQIKYKAELKEKEHQALKADKETEREAKKNECQAIEADKENEHQATEYAKDNKRKFEIYKMELAAKLNITPVNRNAPKKDEFNVQSA